MKIKTAQNTIAITATTLFLAGATAAIAADSEMASVQQQVQQLLYQNQQLTKRIAEMDKAIRTEGAPEAANEEAAPTLSQYVSIGGAIEVEASWSEDFDAVSESSIDLVTAEFGLEAQVGKWATGAIAVEWDGDDDKLTVDEAFIVVGNEEQFPLTGQFGRYVVPFGVYEGGTLSDPLTKEVFETKEDAAMASLTVGDFCGNIYIYNGETNKDGGEDTIEHYGVSFGYERESDKFVVAAGIGYVNSVFDSDGLTDSFPDDMEAEYAGGLGVNGTFSMAGVSLFAEYITALDPVNGVEPSAWQLEANYAMEVAEHELVFAVAYSQTEELGGVFPESRVAGTVGIGLTDGLGLAIEYVHDKDYTQDKNGTDASADAFTVQLAYEF